MVTVLCSLFMADAYIEKYLENLASQDCQDQLEYMFVLVNPSARVRDQIADFQEAHQRSKVFVSRELITIYEAWNWGIRHSTAPYITNANADDTRRSDSMRIQMRILETNPEVDVAYQDYWFALEPHLPWRYYEELGHRTQLLPVTPVRLLNEMNGPHCAPMWRRSLHDELGLFDSSFQAQGDNDFWFRCALAGKKFMKGDDVHVAYFANPGGMSTKANGPANLEGERLRRRYWTPARESRFNIGRDLNRSGTST